MKAKHYLKAIVIVLVTAHCAAGGIYMAGSRSEPPTHRSNSYYVTNREPLAPSPFVKLPIGAIKPKGWLRHMLELERDGMVGHLPHLARLVSLLVVGDPSKEVLAFRMGALVALGRDEEGWRLRFVLTPEMARE